MSAVTTDGKFHKLPDIVLLGLAVPSYRDYGLTTPLLQIDKSEQHNWIMDNLIKVNPVLEMSGEILSITEGKPPRFLRSSCYFSVHPIVPHTVTCIQSY